MKVGDYVRTKEGIITKIKWVIEERGTLNNIIEGRYQCDNNEVYIYPNEFVTSPNIIGLIRIGDYVNGGIVIEIAKHYIRTNGAKGLLLQLIDKDKPEDIKSIVTKEQFESMEYKIKSEVN